LNDTSLKAVGVAASQYRRHPKRFKERKHLVLASDEDGSTLAALKYSLASDIVELVVLTVDARFLQTLRDAVGNARRLWHVLAADKVSDLLVAGQVGIFVLDVQGLNVPANLFVQQIKRQFPDLVVVVAGNRGDETTLAGLISAGLVYRFIHKPMSPARAKLFAEAAIKKFDEQRRRAAETPKRARAPVSNRWWLIGGAALILLIVAVGFIVHRSGGEDTALTPSADTVKPAKESPLLARAAAALAANRLTEPKGDNALELYLQMQARNPADADARAGVAEVHEQLLARAENALLEERLDEAASAVETARNAGVESGRIAVLTARLAKMREQVKVAQAQIQLQSRPRNAPKAEENQATPVSAQVARLPAAAGPTATAGPTAIVGPTAKGPTAKGATAKGPAATTVAARAKAEPTHTSSAAASTQSAADAWNQALKNVNERLLQDRLIEPENDNARYYFLTLRQLDPGNAALDSVLQDLGARLTVKARRALILGQYDAARSWLDETTSIGFSSPEIASLQQHLDAAVTKQKFMTTLFPVSQLKLLKSVQPAYPYRAQVSKTEGWVDVEFTVAESGNVKDIVVKATSTPGIFENAAVKAVSQWRYQPVVREATTVPVRTQLRIRFNLS
jgi:TonB family protein